MSEYQTCLIQLKEARLIREDNQYFELAHDALATIMSSKLKSNIYQAVSDFSERLQMSFIERRGYLSEQDVSLYNKYQKGILEELVGGRHDEKIQEYIEGLEGEDNKIKTDNYIKEINNYVEISHRHNEKERESDASKRIIIRQKVSNNMLKYTLLVLIVAIGWGSKIFYDISSKKPAGYRKGLSEYFQESANRFKVNAVAYAKSENYNDALYILMQADSLAPNDKETKRLIIEYRKRLNR